MTIYNVLVVEDEPAHAHLIERAFESQQTKYSIDIVTNLRDARRHIDGEQPNLAFVDILLPDGRGTDLLAERTSTGTFPIVVMTSHGDEQVAVDAMKAGALDYVVKSPSTLSELPRIAERTMREWRHIIARRSAEAEMRRTTAELRAFIESAAQGVIAVDRTGHIVLVNQQLEMQFGYHRDELLGQPLEVLIPGKHRAIHDLHRQRYVQKPYVGSMGARAEVMALRKDGSEFPVEVGLSYIETEGNLRILALVMDISLRKRLEAEALEAERIHMELIKERELRQHKDRFLSLISHEFRTPLAVILSSSEMLRNYGDRMDAGRRDEFFTKIEGNVRALDEMINDVLLLAKSEMKRVDRNPNWTNLQSFCITVVESVRKAASTERIFLTVRASQEEVYIDRYLMEHVLNNLLVNALKYSSEETPVLLNVVYEDREVTFMVVDQGIGIPQDDQPHIFEPFQRASNVGDTPGTGVGLAVVKDFVELQEGRISIVSSLSSGTTVSVVIPAQPPADQAPRGESGMIDYPPVQ